MESKRDRFKRLATHRTNEVLKRLNVLSHCANKQSYEYTQEEINLIFKEIDKATKEAKAKFRFSKKRAFSL